MRKYKQNKFHVHTRWKDGVSCKKYTDAYQEDRDLRLAHLQCKYVIDSFQHYLMLDKKRTSE